MKFEIAIDIRITCDVKPDGDAIRHAAREAAELAERLLGSTHPVLVAWSEPKPRDGS